jgi:nucleotide-binding universal stress UspA family protein
LTSVPPGAREEARRRLDELVGTQAADLHVDVVVTEGPAYRGILQQATREETDLIVVGGRRPEGELPVFGSTAIRVMRHAPCPVLAFPAQAG